MADYNWQGDRNNPKRSRQRMAQPGSVGLEAPTDTGTQELTVDALAEQPGEERVDEDEYELEMIEHEAKRRKEWRFAAIIVCVVFVAILGAVLIMFWHAKKSSETVEARHNMNNVTGLEVKTQDEVLTEDDSAAMRMFEDDNAFSIYSTTDRLREIYVGWVDDPSIQTDGEFIKECQMDYASAVYPSNDWTADEVIASYTESPDIWATYHNKWRSEDHFICWTPDYQHCFELEFDDNEGKIMTGWFCVNGVRVKMLDQVTFDAVDPASMVARYVSGEWNGSFVRSTDGGTGVEMNRSGQIAYLFDTEVYTDQQDPEGLAYVDYAPPWWLDETTHDVDFYEDHNFGHDGSVWISGYVEVYPDLSDDIDVDGIILARRRNEIGTLIATKDGAMLFSKGNLLTSWVFDQALPKENLTSTDTSSNAHTCSMTMPGVGAEVVDIGYIYDGKRILALEPDGQVSILIDEVLVEEKVSPYSTAFSWSDAIGLRGDSLVLCEFESYKNEYETRVLATEVQSVDFVEMRTFEREDGLYALAYDDDYEIVAVYLGKESKQYYSDLYETLNYAQHGAFKAQE